MNKRYTKTWEMWRHTCALLAVHANADGMKCTLSGVEICQIEDEYIVFHSRGKLIHVALPYEDIEYIELLGE